MNARPQFYGDNTISLPIPSGSEYVQRLIATNTANVIISALGEAHAMMQAAVNADGSVKDEDALAEVRRCVNIAMVNYEMFTSGLALPDGTKVSWPSGGVDDYTGIITSSRLNNDGGYTYVVVEDSNNDVYNMRIGQFRVI